MYKIQMVDLASFLMSMSFFGWKIATEYVLVGLILVVLGGTIIDKLGLESQIQDYIREIGNNDIDVEEMTRKDRIAYSKEQVMYIVKM